MYRIENLDSTEEANRVLRMIQESFQTPSASQGISDASAGRINSNAPVVNSNIVLNTVAVGAISSPTNVTISVGSNPPEYGFGAEWGNNWGL
jgi:hypothetical protein